ncbi:MULTISPECIES: hypothetical protein [Sphingobacterium]|uniref:hypothetical protein n=1 Tax=Sphingobacterium TaxID=28453 RepID=UPI00257F341B|nr:MULTISPECIES: hypothetical protein [Sphingobacterium]
MSYTKYKKSTDKGADNGFHRDPNWKRQNVATLDSINSVPQFREISAFDLVWPIVFEPVRPSGGIQCEQEKCALSIYLGTGIAVDPQLFDKSSPLHLMRDAKRRIHLQVPSLIVSQLSECSLSSENKLCLNQIRFLLVNDRIFWCFHQSNIPKHVKTLKTLKYAE